MSNTGITLHDGKIDAMIEGMRRVQRAPQREWLQSVIETLAQLQPGERLTIERMLEPQRDTERHRMSKGERSMIRALERRYYRALSREEEQQAVQHARGLRESGGALWQWN